jgi:hypothetical protein
MNRFTAFAAILLAITTSSALSQAPAPAAAPAPAPGTPASNRALLATIRETNAKLLEQQAKTLQLLEEMEKTSQAMKMLGKRA